MRAQVFVIEFVRLRRSQKFNTVDGEQNGEEERDELVHGARLVVHFDLHSPSPAEPAARSERTTGFGRHTQNAVGLPKPASFSLNKESLTANGRAGWN